MERAIRTLQTQVSEMQRGMAAMRVELDFARDGKQTRLPMAFPSQFGEDILAWSLFAGKRDGFFVEAGAFDGISYSTTYALECVGWNGLLVEALPEPARQCRMRRPYSRVVHAALVERGATGEAEFTVTEDQYGGMLSYLNTTAQHQAATAALKKTTVRVPVACLDDLMAPDQRVDLAALDLEGGERPALDGFDLDRHRPRLMIIENNEAAPELRQYLAGRHYRYVARLAVNDLYVRDDDPEMIERAAAAVRSAA